MAETFTAPDFIEELTTDAIHARMMAELPDDIDDMPGGFPWDFTRPSALMLAEFTSNRLMRVLMLMFPQFAWGKWLDYHGVMAGNTVRRPARAATGTLRITTDVSGIGKTIPKGTLFCTPATDTSDSILYSTDEDCEILTGEAEIPITAVNPGSSGNVMEGAISLAFKPITSLKSIANIGAITDGSDEEDDESYRERILEWHRSGLHNTGCPADYVRWAKEIPGVGSAICIPEWDGPGTVKLVISDASGAPASEAILNDVRTHIMATSSTLLNRLAPVGASLTVVAPVEIDIYYVVQVRVADGYQTEDVKQAILSGLEDYYEEAINDEELKWADCFARITNADGVYDARGFTLNGGTENIAISKTQLPRTAGLTVTVY